MNAPSLVLAPRAEAALEEALTADGVSVFNAIALEGGLPDGAITLRKLQVLYWLRSRHPTTRTEMLRELASWRGTGRNEVVPFEASHLAPGLLDQMVGAELLWEMGAQQKRLVVSPKGMALLTRLHPACEDLDLPWRLARWEEAPSAEREAERYGSALRAKQQGFAPREPDREWRA